MAQGVWEAPVRFADVKAAGGWQWWQGNTIQAAMRPNKSRRWIAATGVVRCYIRFQTGQIW